MDMSTPYSPKPLVNVTCKLGEKGCFKDGRCHALGDCENKIVTNDDWIRSMTKKELVAFIGHNSLCDRVQGEVGNWCNDHNCTDCLEEWLKQPVEVE